LSEQLSLFLHDDGKYERMLRFEEEVIVDFHDLYDFNAELARSLLDAPIDFFARMDSVVEGRPLRITNLISPTNIRDISSADIGKLIQVDAVVMTASIPDSTLTVAHFECVGCGDTTVVDQIRHKLKKPGSCGHCHARGGFDLLIEDGTYIDTQDLGLQESPEELPPGEVPEPLSAMLSEGLVRTVSPGDRARVTGVVKLRERKGSGRAFSRIIEVNFIESSNRNPAELELSPEQVMQYKALSTRPNLEELLIDSYAPSIYGWRHVKQGLLYAQFGGVRKLKGNIEIRGDLNILLVGDPGTGKSQLLQFSSKVSPRGVYASSGGVSGVGLTGALVKDGDRYMLSAGTMALADMGMACIDELEKMDKEDREKIHPAMSQGIIPISKADVRATLNSRCALVAACNPTDGRYNVYKTIPENVKDFPPSLISRFDLIFIFLDKAEEEHDRLMANRILQIGDDTPRIIPFDELKGYITYAKKLTPSVPEEILIYIRDYFIEKRKHQAQDAGLYITARQLEGLSRMTEARARMHLREEATMEDAEAAIELFEAFISETCQDPYTGKIDIDIIGDGPPKSLRVQSDRVRLVVEVMLQELDGERSYVFKGALINFLVREWGVMKVRAEQIIDLAEQKDLLFNPYLDHIKLA